VFLDVVVVQIVVNFLGAQQQYVLVILNLLIITTRPFSTGKGTFVSKKQNSLSFSTKTFGHKMSGKRLIWRAFLKAKL
jgi:hypothetical protein